MRSRRESVMLVNVPTEDVAKPPRPFVGVTAVFRSASVHRAFAAAVVWRPPTTISFVMLARVAAVSMTLTACGASATQSTPSSSSTSASAAATVTGRVTAGPTCPVERPGHPCPPAPVSATVRAVPAHGDAVASTHTDTTGRYRLHVRPGAYTIIVVTPNGLPRCPPVGVTAKPRQTIRAAISCDTGIR
jgi:hypothetical protein